MYSFPIWSQYIAPVLTVLTVAFWSAYRFLRRQVRWCGIPISLRIFHSLLWSTQAKALAVNKAEINVFLELSCFSDDPADVGNLISGSIQKTKIMASDPITSWQIDVKQWKQWLTLFFWAPKSLQMAIAAMKLKDAYSLEGKLWPT